MSYSVVSTFSSKSFMVSSLTFRSLIHFKFILMYGVKRASLVVQTVKNPPAMWDTWVRSLDWEDPLEEGLATYSRILAWRMSWTEEPVDYSP